MVSVHFLGKHSTLKLKYASVYYMDCLTEWHLFFASFIFMVSYYVLFQSYIKIFQNLIAKTSWNFTRSLSFQFRGNKNLFFLQNTTFWDWLFKEYLPLIKYWQWSNLKPYFISKPSGFQSQAVFQKVFCFAVV